MIAKESKDTSVKIYRSDVEIKEHLDWALTMLHEIHLLVPTAHSISFCIAGGFLRDLYFDREIKDLDIFTPVPIFKDTRGFISLSNILLSNKYYMRVSSHDNNYHNLYGKTYLIRTEVWKPLTSGTKYPYPINIVTIDKQVSTEMLLKEFPTDLSQFAIDTKNNVYKPQSLQKIQQGFAFIREGKNDYLKKLSAKYPEICFTFTNNIPKPEVVHCS